MRERRLPREEVQARAAARCKGFAPPPKVELSTLGPAGIRELCESGGGDFDQLETALVMSARIDGPLQLAIGEGLVKLTKDDWLLQSGPRLDISDPD